MRVLIGKIHHRNHLIHGKKHTNAATNLDQLKNMLKDMELTHTSGSMKMSRRKHTKIAI